MDLARKKVYLTVALIMGFLGAAHLYVGLGRKMEWRIVSGICFAVLIICAYGFWKSKAWALSWSRGIAVFFILIGCLIEYMIWDLRCFMSCMSFGQLMSEMLHPRSSFYLILPAIWLVYTSRRDVKAQFG